LGPGSRSTHHLPPTYMKGICDWFIVTTFLLPFLDCSNQFVFT
jgi:hypothetical protein